MIGNPITICSNAFVRLGGSKIASFGEGSAEAEIASALYTQTYHALLTETLWHFATRTSSLARLLDTPDNGYSSKFQLPEDLLYLVCADTGKYEIYERELYANADAVNIEMIYAVKEVNLPVYFITALELKLAAVFTVPLTGNSSRAELMEGLAGIELRKARRADASQRPAAQMGEARYLTARVV